MKKDFLLEIKRNMVTFGRWEKEKEELLFVMQYFLVEVGRRWEV